MPKLADGLMLGADGLARCWWGMSAEDYMLYHDSEWGRPVTEDRRLFEKICLEGFQAGLSWLTILRKRDNFRRAFAEFDFRQVAQFDSKDVERLVQDAGIVRHRQKIESTINNAQRACEMVDQLGSLSEYFWSFKPAENERPKKFTKEILSQLSMTPVSKKLSRDLKQRGWSFVGPTTVYAFMQAMGLVNDHLTGCAFR
jgi:DNA-3-methyladenine glycosylase I